MDAKDVATEESVEDVVGLNEEKEEKEDVVSSEEEEEEEEEEEDPELVFEESDAWRATIRRVLPAVVVLKTALVRGFDGDAAGSGEATGFIVAADGDFGLVLTNRHVVGTGPLTATMTFHCREEVDCVPVYRDPVHDFAFVRFDRRHVRHAKMAEIPLNPEGAVLGCDLRVIGNDAGERLSILSGTLARTDKNSPDYGQATYSDTNTFYLGAASNTSPGSSGSPVINVRGEAIGLNCGGKSDAASSYYLPLDRVVRALDLIKQQKFVPRGGINAVFTHEPFNEAAKLGLDPATESRIRKHFPDETGVLCCRKVGVDSGTPLQPGDLLVEVNGSILTSFVELEDVLDKAVEAGNPVEVVVERGGDPLTFSLTVSDLHQGVPSQFLEVGGGVLHPLSECIALQENLVPGQAVLSESGFMFDMASMTTSTIIAGVDGEDTPKFEDVVAALAKLPDGKHFTVQMRHVVDQRYSYVDMLTFNRRFFPMTRFRRDVLTDIRRTAVASPVWNREELPLAPSLPASVTDAGSSSGVLVTNRFEEAAAPALVMVYFRAPFATEGFKHKRSYGVGVILDKRLGVILVDRATCPLMLGEVELTVAGSITVPGQTFYLHPYLNFGLVKFNPAGLESIIADVDLSPLPVKEGDKFTLVGLTSSHTVVCEPARLTQLDYYALQGADTRVVPVHRPYNTERATFEPANVLSRGGVYLDRLCRVRCLWSLWEDGSQLLQLGMPSAAVAEPVQQLLTRLRHGGDVHLQRAPATLLLRGVAEARLAFGLPESWANRLEASGRGKKDVVYVHKTDAGQEASGLVRGDMLLAVDGKPVTTLAAFEEACRLRDSVDVTLLRDGEVVVSSIQTVPVDGRGSATEMVIWAGLCLHETHLAVLQLGFVPPDAPGALFCSYTLRGSPGREVNPTSAWLLEINGRPVPDVQSLLAVVSELPDRKYVRLKIQDVFSSRLRLVTFKTDNTFFPLQHLSLTNDFQWKRRAFDGPARAAPNPVPLERLRPGLAAAQGDAGLLRRFSRRLPALRTPTVQKWVVGGVGALAVAAAAAAYSVWSSPRVRQRLRWPVTSNK